jgi:hypothetical protein
MKETPGRRTVTSSLYETSTDPPAPTTFYSKLLQKRRREQFFPFWIFASGSVFVLPFPLPVLSLVAFLYLYPTNSQSTYSYIKSTTVYVHSSELGLSQPLSRQRVCPSPHNRGGGAPAGEGLGGPNSDDWRKA